MCGIHSSIEGYFAGANVDVNGAGGLKDVDDNSLAGVAYLDAYQAEDLYRRGMLRAQRTIVPSGWGITGRSWKNLLRYSVSNAFAFAEDWRAKDVLKRRDFLKGVGRSGSRSSWAVDV